jgi:hypothetical protein
MNDIHPYVLAMRQFLSSNTPEEVAAAEQALREAQLHAEPFWMQDVRLAQRRLEAQRSELAARSNPEGQAASDNSR